MADKPLQPHEIAALGAIVDNLAVCPHPDKKRYKSVHAARLWAGRRGLNYYKCVCGVYHLTSYGGAKNRDFRR